MCSLLHESLLVAVSFWTTEVTHKEAVADLVRIQSYFYKNSINQTNLNGIEDQLVSLLLQNVIQTYISDYFTWTNGHLFTSNLPTCKFEVITSFIYSA
ncbi:putative multidrug ABC transporter [Trichinella spiralis]|uniref:putative multidrug ABC transporter n=1 Tax=Trichinella spiralis TaxID=6334 RepID=UPI0001EFC0CF|nr:putative multidrug ABC transporter [Trichinella spiralis]